MTRRSRLERERCKKFRSLMTIMRTLVEQNLPKEVRTVVASDHAGREGRVRTVNVQQKMIAQRT